MQSELNQENVPLTAWWGKLGAGGGAQGYHPLICHMIDVAAVAGAMWDTVLSPAARQAMTRGLGMNDEAATRAWVVFLAGAHDLGKACPAFQLRPEARALAGLYAPFGPPRPGLLARDAPHGTVTALVLPDLLVRKYSVAPQTAQRLALVTGGHHGFFPGGEAIERLEEQPNALGRGPWRPARERLLSALADLLQFQASAVPTGLSNATAMELACLISVADWIGSDQDQFRYAFDRLSIPPEFDIRQYAHTAHDKAKQALDKHGWTGWNQPDVAEDFATLFPEIAEPRPLQLAAVQLANAEAPGIVVVESPTGEGKTEAALYLADRWGLKPGPRGFYLALPTQAASNQMFGRVRKFLASRYPADRVNLQLLHGHAALSAEFEIMRREGDRLFVPRDVNPEDPEAGVAAAAWFTGSKRGLLASFGVGTVDQGLLAALQTRHVFVRLFGLAHRLVVIDEIHAYDTYMTTLIERMLEWLAALGSPVILLSATLPRERRQRLLAAYARGLGVPLDSGISADYPRISWLHVDVGSNRLIEQSQHVPPSDRSRRTVRLEWLQNLSLDDAAGRHMLGQRLQHALANGGCAAIICNTVARAQAVYRALKDFFPAIAEDGDPELDLLHARFPFEDRQRREGRALRRFGPPDQSIRPYRAVLVATQIIEQSLDLDFDLMVTELAPADLVLQRAGRLQRHDRARPAGLTSPDLWLCGPPEESGVPRFASADVFIYDEHVLLRSWLTLRHCAELVVPDGVEELVEAVYDGRTPVDLAPALQSRWAETRDELLADQKRESEEAKERWLRRPSADVELWKFTDDPRDEDAPNFHEKHQALTRLTPPSVQIVLLYDTPEGPALEPGGHPLNLSQRPNAEAATQLLARTVTLSDPRIVWPLMQQDAGGKNRPSGWRRFALLRHTFYVGLDAEGSAKVDRCVLHLDPEVGVEILSDVAPHASA